MGQDAGVIDLQRILELKGLKKAEMDRHSRRDCEMRLARYSLEAVLQQLGLT